MPMHPIASGAHLLWKEEVLMLKKALALFIFSAFLFTLEGCETMKGAASGTYEGAKKDWVGVQNTWGKLKEADAWMQKNLW
jgi:predicted small secreted protein